MGTGRKAATIAVVGATGAVGRELLTLLARRGVAAERLCCLASARSAGTRLPYADSVCDVGEAAEDSFGDVEFAIFTAGSEASRRLAPAAVEAGATVIDNSSAFRLEAAVPLVIPEVNGEVVSLVSGRPSIIANPNCSTIILLMALDPLRRAFGVERAVVATYQAASGAGGAAVQELVDQSAAYLAGEPTVPKVFHEPCAFNVFSHDSPVDPQSGSNVEERKMADEARKIWDDPQVQIVATCLRVPVLRAHAEAVNVTLSRPATEARLRAVLAAAPGLELVDDRAANHFPTSLRATMRDAVLVGRVRPDPSQPVVEQDGEPAYHGYSLLACGDQLRKGAALNALQILDLVL